MSTFARIVLPLVVGGAVQAQVTQRLSENSGGAEGNGVSFFSEPRTATTTDGRFAMFAGGASNLAPGDTNSAFDVLLKDRLLGSTELVSVSTSGTPGNGDSGLSGMAMSADGRYIAFASFATNLVAGDTNNTIDIFLRDRQNGTTVLVSADSSGVQGNLVSFEPSITPDGRFVAFSSQATNLVPGDTNGVWDVFVRDTLLGTTVRASVSTGGVEGNGASWDADLTPDGRYMVFQSQATNLVAGSFQSSTQIFLRDMQTGTVECISLAAPGVGGSASSAHPSLSADGRFVAFSSVAADLIAGDTNGVLDCFVRDRLLGTTDVVSASLGGSSGNGACGLAQISTDGRFVAFDSDASDLVAGDTNMNRDVFVRDLAAGTTERVTLDSSGAETDGFARLGSISADGRFVSFSSSATTLVSGDTGSFLDTFLRDRAASGFESACDAGGSGMLACPCSNQPAGAGQGCNNSANTGGAVLAATGAAYLSLDTLAFSTSGEMPSATSVVLQGDQFVAGGLVFGQGLRCAGGTLKRLFVKSASGGSITAPELGAGDPGVAARSAALGSPIQPGLPYAYLVYYRDPVVLGGCPAASTFNVTQTGLITWFP
ncbi:MAG: PD40 domain-containing protein [Planctomycetes bacterium]|nr:PD40 domain-containing protein [Planctomycetota bacterium]